MTGLKRMDRSEFILAAINDAQATIRSIDVKVTALLAGLLIPLSSLGKIWNHLSHIHSLDHPYFTVLIGALFFLAWLIAVFSLVRTVSAIDNPAKHILNSGHYKGIFYGAGLFGFGALDVLLNRPIIKGSTDVASFSKDYPASEEEVVSELSFEHMKLIYIREFKLHRFKYSMKIATTWLLLGLSIYFYSKFA